MKHKTWFRLVLKAIGVLLIALGLPQFIGIMIQSIYFAIIGASALGFGGGGVLEMLSWNLHTLVIGLLQTILGFYLFFGGKWIVNLCIPSNKTYCPECGYDMGRSGSVTCPECGVRVRAVEAPPVAD